MSIPTESMRGIAMTEIQAATQQSPVHEHSYIHNNTKDDYLKRLRRIEGQARGLQRMVEEEQYCIDILTQVSAMTKALQSVALGLLDEHMAHCVVDAAREGGPRGRDQAQGSLRRDRPSRPLLNNRANPTRPTQHIQPSTPNPKE